jgi:acyl-CoA thioester hydrolase
VLAVADASLRFHAPARYDEQIVVETTVAEVRSRTVTFRYVVSNAMSGKKLVTASTTLICLGPSGNVVALPGEVRSLLQDQVA